MRYTLLAAVAVTVLASPAVARDGQPYVGIEGGLLFPKDNDADVFADYTTTPVDPTAPTPPADTTFDDAVGLEYKTGYDLDLIAGYDFGFIRLEGELGYKRAKLDEFGVDQSFVDSLNLALNRPAASPDPTVPGLTPLSADDFDLDGKVSIWSGMINALADFGNEDGLSFYAGGGVGRAKVKLLGDSDSSWAFQLIAGARYALSDNVDIGLKYRYFQTGNIELDDGSAAFDGNTQRYFVGPNLTQVDQTTNAVVTTDFEDKFRSHSLLASLIFNFGGASVAPAPVYVAPPPAPAPAPATQTCYDGSVILATDICPSPPAPPPAPMPMPERG